MSHVYFMWSAMFSPDTCLIESRRANFLHQNSEVDPIALNDARQSIQKRWLFQGDHPIHLASNTWFQICVNSSGYCQAKSSTDVFSSKKRNRLQWSLTTYWFIYLPLNAGLFNFYSLLISLLPCWQLHQTTKSQVIEITSSHQACFWE